MRNSLHRRFASLLLVSLALLPAWRLAAQTNTDTSKWEAEIKAFEASDKTNMPPKGAILFTGSSTIRKWTTLTNDFPGKPVFNRGFGGSQISDAIALADRIIFPYAPKTIVFYSGDNDLASGKKPERVVADYRTFVELVHKRLPDTRIVIISIKPCPSRWKLNDEVKTVNQELAAMQGDKLTFVNIYPDMLGDDGLPKKDLFLKDGLHPSAKCYEMWAKVIGPVLDSQ
jgi:lysophospholipase L1-like esterase